MPADADGDYAAGHADYRRRPASEHKTRTTTESTRSYATVDLAASESTIPTLDLANEDCE